jgi:hypothetical protein
MRLSENEPTLLSAGVHHHDAELRKELLSIGLPALLLELLLLIVLPVMLAPMSDPHFV